MTQALHAAAAALAAILTEENAALATLDLPRAAGLTAAKRAATNAFTTAHARLAASGSPTLDAHTTTHLRDLAAENRRLLNRALATQTRVLDIIAQAVPRASTQAPRYSATATLVGRARALPVAITASA